jgi:hypothetical protein
VIRVQFDDICELVFRDHPSLQRRRDGAIARA